MIRHCVFVRFQPDFPAADRDAIYADLLALKAEVPGFISMSAGPNISPEPLDKGFRHGFTMDFESMDALKAYLVHPKHQAAGGKIVAAAQGGPEGLLVYDLEI